ncbi:zinc ribbon domain-containing protein [Levilactobacillus parabrevis]|uniref:zinc ribbon domain-containing protein n=1 Tax=Levilactobacillus parabrevis TaxID=357278 RepID=UPI0021A73997|nr:zinc-ribbon domain-containing protein [Levilactobacillus parabrevis]MCT4486413.1 zinc-ribbon domain-containing protein [Levilactobacillus parabrevis]MCT4489993.1 zinc-ribbon domain-containing protein [Levilactobacillus parabrevis]
MNNATKFCPNCGNEVKADAKFCPKCGHNLTATTSATGATQQSTTTQESRSAKTTESVQRAKRFSGNFFSWWLKTVRHPATMVPDTHKYFGVTAFLLNIVVIVLAFVVLANRVASAATKALNNMTDEPVHFGGVIFKLSLFLLVFLAVGAIIYIAVGFGFRKIADIEGRFSIWDYTNRLASLTNLILVFCVIIFVFTLFMSPDSLESYGRMLGLFSPIFLILNVGYLFSTVDGVDHPRWDKFYTVLLALIAISIALSIYLLIVRNFVGGSITNYLENFTNGLTDSFNNNNY